jgi:hypothetical protein
LPRSKSRVQIPSPAPLFKSPLRISSKRKKSR